MNSHTYIQQIKIRLKVMEHNPAPNLPWPEGCYGSGNSWLVFVGPSPGGAPEDESPEIRKSDGGLCLWNEPFEDPLRNWSSGFRSSIRPLVEHLTGLKWDDGASKIYAFVNFDWVSSPEESKVSQERMEKGKPDVLRMLETIKPKVILTLGQRAHDLLRQSLEDNDCVIIEPGKSKVLIKIDENRYHRYLLGYKIEKCKPLEGSVVIKCPQHPAWIREKTYARRCGRALRQMLENVDEGAINFSIEELN